MKPTQQFIHRKGLEEREVLFSDIDPKFKDGDKVKINITQRNDDYYIQDNYDYDGGSGKIYGDTENQYEGEFTYSVMFDDGEYWYYLERDIILLEGSEDDRH